LRGIFEIFPIKNYLKVSETQYARSHPEGCSPEKPLARKKKRLGFNGTPKKSSDFAGNGNPRKLPSQSL
jgi:hypothetical protein